ncbi:hypothetical protein E2C01_069612 [Portunus trituberculatus]|uniref:Uncharacterized protein n=1 Tax=Portunus trituberculatus TaxID=210409 RepID=A0A5B7I2T3_PORTR|nr:hypothetical protein [Portunus trituberculatus]
MTTVGVKSTVFVTLAKFSLVITFPTSVFARQAGGLRVNSSSQQLRTLPLALCHLAPYKTWDTTLHCEYFRELSFFPTVRVIPSGGSRATYGFCPLQYVSLLTRIEQELQHKQGSDHGGPGGETVAPTTVFIAAHFCLVSSRADRCVASQVR